MNIVSRVKDGHCLKGDKLVLLKKLKMNIALKTLKKNILLRCKFDMLEGPIMNIAEICV